MIRIIAGKYKGRAFAKQKGKFRPSTSRTREAIFSILASGKYVAREFLSQAKVLDLFAGSGSLSFEALSRGAQSACLIDNNRMHIKFAREFADSIEAPCSFLCTDASALPYSGEQYNLIFLDPPYQYNLITKTLDSLIDQNWLAPGAIIIAEMEKREDIIIPCKIEALETKYYGNSKIVIMRYEQT